MQADRGGGVFLKFCLLKSDLTATCSEAGFLVAVLDVGTILESNFSVLELKICHFDQ